MLLDLHCLDLHYIAVLRQVRHESQLCICHAGSTAMPPGSARGRPVLILRGGTDAAFAHLYIFCASIDYLR